MHPFSRPSRWVLGPAMLLALIVPAPAIGAPMEPSSHRENGVTVVVDLADRAESAESVAEEEETAPADTNPLVWVAVGILMVVLATVSTRKKRG